MRRFVLTLCILSVPCMLFLTAYQGARFYAVSAELKRLESVQADWVEENRRLLADIAVAKSRSRVDASMAGNPGYRTVSPKTTLRIRVGPGMEKQDG